MVTAVLWAEQWTGPLKVSDLSSSRKRGGAADGPEYTGEAEGRERGFDQQARVLLATEWDPSPGSGNDRTFTVSRG